MDHLHWISSLPPARRKRISSNSAVREDYICEYIIPLPSPLLLPFALPFILRLVLYYSVLSLTFTFSYFFFANFMLRNARIVAILYVLFFFLSICLSPFLTHFFFCSVFVFAHFEEYFLTPALQLFGNKH